MTSQNEEKFRTAEETKIRKKLVSLPKDRIYEYFEGIEKILTELNDAKRELEAEETLRLETLREIKEFCVNARKTLSEIRNDVVEEVNAYELKREEALSYLKTEVPDLVSNIQELHKIKTRLEELKFARPFEFELKNIELALHERDYNMVLTRYISSISETSRVPPSILSSFNEKANQLDKGLITDLQKHLHQVFENINFPFDVAVDFRAVKQQLKTSVLILKCLRTIYKRNGEKSDEQVLDIIFDLFRQSFDYHFNGEQRTNDMAKPEWFFSQTIQWIANNIEYFEVYIQKMVDGWDLPTSPDEMFVISLVFKVYDKVQAWLNKSSFVNNRVFFSHLLDESISFTNEMYDIVGYSDQMPEVMELFVKPGIFDEWVELEKDAISVGVDEILADKNAYQCRFEEAKDIDNYLVPNFADTFIVLMKSMSERYMIINDSTLRSKFLKHQLIIVHEFLSRIARIFHEIETPWTQPYPTLMNAVWYIAVVLDEWSAEEQYIEVVGLDEAKNLARGTFDETAELYRVEWRKRIKFMVTSFRHHIHVAIKDYASEPWMQMNHAKPIDFTTSIKPFVDEIGVRLKWIQENISDATRLALSHLLNTEIWNCILEDAIYSTYFTHRAASQMLYDIQSALVPLLNSAFVPSRRDLQLDSGFNHFDVTKDRRYQEAINVLKVLAIPSAAAVLFRDQVIRIPESMVQEQLDPFQIKDLDKERLLELFDRRCDMHRIT